MTTLIEGINGEQLTEMFNSLGKKIDGLKELVKGIALEANKSVLRHEYLTTKEACEFLKVSAMSLRRWSTAGVLKPKRVGGKVYYKRTDMENLMSDGEV